MTFSDLLLFQNPMYNIFFSSICQKLRIICISYSQGFQPVPVPAVPGSQVPVPAVLGLKYRYQVTIECFTMLSLVPVPAVLGQYRQGRSQDFAKGGARAQGGPHWGPQGPSLGALGPSEGARGAI